MKEVKLLILLILLLYSCDKDEPINPENPSVDILEKVETDKSRYSPGETVIIRLFLKNQNCESINVKYKHLTNTIKEENLTVSGNQLEINWLPPAEDFTGYLIEFEFLADAAVVDYGSTAVDVSSDWTKFPRYGFLSKFSDLSNSTIESNIATLNTFHINGLQFYDWHNKHHIPLPTSNGLPANNWQDIARRNISFNCVQIYFYSE